jgi:hypothetical protein
VVAVDAMTPAVGDGPPVAAVYTTGFRAFKICVIENVEQFGAKLQTQLLRDERGTQPVHGSSPVETDLSLANYCQR